MPVVPLKAQRCKAEGPKVMLFVPCNEGAKKTYTVSSPRSRRSFGMEPTIAGARLRPRRLLPFHPSVAGATAPLFRGAGGVCSSFLALQSHPDDSGGRISTPLLHAQHAPSSYHAQLYCRQGGIRFPRDHAEMLHSVQHDMQERRRIMPSRSPHHESS